MPFIEDNCNYCGDCLTNCQYINLKRDEAIKEIKNLIENRDSFVLSECVTCYACNEYCKQDANPFDLIASIQEEKNSLRLSKTALKMLEKQYEPYVFSIEIDIKGPLMSQCAFLFSHEDFFKGKIFENLTMVGGRSVFCNLIYLHTQQYSLIKKRAKMIVNNIEKILKKFKKKELICFHDECYLFYTKYAPEFGIEVPFKAIHIFEYLLNYIKDHKDQIKPLNLKVAYQRSCSTRMTPEKDHFLDELFEIIGVKRVERKFDRENAICCQAPLMGLLNLKKLGRKNQKENIQDAIDAGAKAMIFICPTCYDTLKRGCEKNNLRPIFITDLCRLALREI